MAHDATRHLPIASTTKLMTAYLALQELRLDKRVREAPYSAIPGESLLGVAAGKRISVRDLLYGLILRSGNDAAVTLARAAAGSEAHFVAQMNRRAAALGLADTRYANPVGLDEAGNYSSAADLATLARRLLAIPAFARIAASRDEELDSLNPPVTITTRNTLLFKAPFATGVKTGHTLGAGYVLVGSGQKKGTKLISAVIGAPSEYERDAESLRLLDYGFGLYRERQALRKGQTLARPEIRFAGGHLALRAVRGMSLGLRREQVLEVKVRAPGELEGPVAKGRHLGVATVYVDGSRAAVIPLAGARAVPEATTWQHVRSYLSENATVLILAACAILLGLLLIARLWRRLRDRGGEDGEGMRADRLQRRLDRESRRDGRVGSGRE